MAVRVVSMRTVSPRSQGIWCSLMRCQPHSSAIICLCERDGRTIMPLDRVDREMLAILQSEGRISNAALADRLHLSPSPCLRRLRALEQQGVISGYAAILDRPRLGLGLTVFVDLKVERHSEQSAAEISRALSEAP